MTLRLLRGDMRATLAGVESGSVQTCVTSPPYYGLRSYSTPPLVWGGDVEHTHNFGSFVERPGMSGAPSVKQQSNAGSWHGTSKRNFCSCGAWLGHLGLEPTPAAFVEHIVECFRAVRRVLRDDGTVWVNMGDSYAGSGKGPSNSLQPEASQLGKRNVGFNARWSGGAWAEGGKQDHQQPPRGKVPGFKAKDLMMMPARVAMALQADGWYLRSMIPWLKRNAMPESVTDRPATSVEYVFLLSKSARYFYDPDAVRVAGAEPDRLRRNERIGGATGHVVRHGEQGIVNGTLASRNRRNGDWFFESWQGMLLDSDDLPLALVVNPAPYKDAHYATFPPKLVEPMIKASTSERGCCAECGAPWARVVEVTAEYRALLDSGKAWRTNEGKPDEYTNRQQQGHPSQVPTKNATTGWQPTCKHSGGPVPQTVLDCFAGANTTLLVADRLGRNGLGCELSESYSDMGSARLVGDAPMFVELESA